MVRRFLLFCSFSLLTLSLDLSALPSSAPRLLLSAPTQGTPVFLGLALACSTIFFITFTLISFRHKMSEKMTAFLDKPMLHSLSAWIGFFGFMIGTYIASLALRLLSAPLGITSFLILRMWFGKAADDFNDSIVLQGSNGPQIIASVGNAFTSP